MTTPTAPVTSSGTAPVKATVTETAGTEYVILERAGNGSKEWAEFARETARSAEAAIKAALEGNTDGGTFIAVSARSFKPYTVTPQTVTTLKLEEAKS